MMTTNLDITCRDPIVSRDGRPFGAGQGYRMRSAGWPLPSVVAGSLRSTLGKAAQREFSAVTALELRQVQVTGLFPRRNGMLYLPGPNDCVVHPELGPLRATPRAIDRGGCDWPTAGLRPVALAEERSSGDFKPQEGPTWWPVDHYAAWLTNGDVAFDAHFLRAPEQEHRTHVQIDPRAGAADDGNLFTTVALSLTHLPRFAPTSAGTRTSRFAEITLAARVRADGWCGAEVDKLDTLHPLGGERRLVHWKASAATAMSAWECPDRVREALHGLDTKAGAKVKLALATPAIFRDGYKPGWLGDDLSGTPPGATVAVRLVGVSIERWRAVSGWSLAELPGQPRGPKPVRRVVPAGGVYFFEVVEGSAAELAERWLEPISDDEQDRHDGFGLAAWGTW
jgi:CRISPR-associated protein Cmr3